MFSGALYSSSTYSLGLKPPSSPSKKAAPKGREDVPLSVPAGIHFFPYKMQCLQLRDSGWATQALEFKIFSNNILLGNSYLNPLT